MSLKVTNNRKVLNQLLLPPSSSSYIDSNQLRLENEVGCSDATKLADTTNEDAFVHNLKIRFLNKQIYVSHNRLYVEKDTLKKTLYIYGTDEH